MNCTASSGRPFCFEGVPDQIHQRLIGMNGFLSPPKDHSIAGLDGQSGHINSDVGSGLIENTQHSERHALLSQFHSVGQQGFIEMLSHRIGQIRQRTQISGQAIQTRIIQRQAIDQGLAHAGGCWQHSDIGLDLLPGAPAGSTQAATLKSRRVWFFFPVAVFAMILDAVRAFRPISINTIAPPFRFPGIQLLQQNHIVSMNHFIPKMIPENRLDFIGRTSDNLGKIPAIIVDDAAGDFAAIRQNHANGISAIKSTADG